MLINYCKKSCNFTEEKKTAIRLDCTNIKFPELDNRVMYCGYVRESLFLGIIH